ALGSLDEWKAAAIDEMLAPLPDALEAGKRPFYGAIRVAVCGNQVSPPLGESMELLGKDAVMNRIEAAQDLTL
ncbi:MAG: glutamate--tRNA ligase, partial [Atopobiaceae bacterium]|nr:glutamate--tRNA ligase [Atopobiaceae bacterium]